MKITVLYAKPRMTFPIGSWLIRVIEGDKITKPLAGSHVAFCLTVDGQRAVFESVSPVSRIVSLSRWSQRYECIKSWVVDADCSEPESMAWCLENTDKSYSRLQCILLGIADLFGGFIKKLVRKQNPNGSEYLICVEAVSRFLIKFGGFKFEQSPDMIGLKEFVERMAARKI